jgi:hypothetical protein
VQVTSIAGVGEVLQRRFAQRVGKTRVVARARVRVSFHRGERVYDDYHTIVQRRSASAPCTMLDSGARVDTVATNSVTTIQSSSAPRKP